MKKTLSFILLFILISKFVVAQKDFEEVKINFPSSLQEINSNSSNTALGALVIFFPINPIFLLEGKRFYAGITKEFSVGKFPYGRLAAEYSLIFRETRLNQLRFSYNYDIPLAAADIAAVLLSAGGGYFTDFYKEGYFPQLSVSLMLVLEDNIAVNTYFKVRNTFMTESTESDIFDVSFGLATNFYF